MGGASNRKSSIENKKEGLRRGRGVGPLLGGVTTRESERESAGHGASTWRPEPLAGWPEEVPLRDAGGAHEGAGVGPPASRRWLPLPGCRTWPCGNRSLRAKWVG